MPKCKVIAVTNQKGGVGKTTTTENVAIGLARNGCNVLIVDFDPQGDLTSCLGWKNNDSLEHSVSSMLDDYINDNDINYESLILHHEEHVDLIPANIELADFEMRLVSVINREQTLSNCIEPLRNQYDYIFIDCPPSLGMLTGRPCASRTSASASLPRKCSSSTDTHMALRRSGSSATGVIQQKPSAPRRRMLPVTLLSPPCRRTAR